MDRRGFIHGLGASALGLAAGRVWSASGEIGAAREEYLRLVDAALAAGPFADDWASLAGYRAPAWFADAKFGIFIHWGVYSVPAWWSEWYPREMYRSGSATWWHHRLKWGPQHQFGYKDFVPMFTAERFEPAAWAELFARAGARYVVPVAEHHDGFALYDTRLSDWNAVRMGPKRDVIGELAEAVRGRGMTFGLSSHRAEHWWFLNGGRKFRSDVSDPAYADFYGPARPEDQPPDEAFMNDWLARCAELTERYQPEVFWFDWWIEQPAFEPYRRRFAAYYYNRAAQRGQEVVLNYKNQAFPEGTAVLDLERAGLAEIRPLVWQTDTSVSYISWGYIDSSIERFKSAERLIGDLVDTVSKNGALLLNVGPRPDGTIPEEAQNILLDMGRWLEVNGEAIYGTRPWKVFGEGPTARGKNTLFGLGEMLAPALTGKDVRFTVKGDTLYAIFLGRAARGRVAIKALGRDAGIASGDVASIRLVGTSGPALAFSREAEALMIDLPEDQKPDQAFALAISGVVY